MMKHRYGLTKPSGRNALFKDKNDPEKPRETNCPNGIAFCPYNECFNGEPIVAYKEFLSCGRPRDNPCDHPKCKDPLRKYAKGTEMGLHYQMHLNATGEYTEIFPINYLAHDDRILITNPLEMTKVIPSIKHINWDNKTIRVTMQDYGYSYDAQRSHLMRLPKQSYPNLKQLLAMLWTTLCIMILPRTFTRNFSYAPRFRNNKKSKKNQKNQNLVIFIAVLLTAFLMALLPTAASHPTDKLKNQFLYERLNTAIVNPSYLYIGRRYISCDLLESKDSLNSLLSAHRKVCSTRIRQPKHSLIVDSNNDFVLLQEQHSVEHAQHLCKLINSSPVEVKTFSDAQKLNKFLGKNNIASTWAGIKFSFRMAEPVFMSDSSLAAYVVYSNVEYTRGTHTNTSNWQFVTHLGSHQDDGFSFVYEKSNTDMAILRAFITPTHSQTTSKTRQYQDVGNVRQLNIVCNKPKNFENPTPLGWHSACRQKNNQMRIKMKIAFQKIEDIMPSNLPQQPRPFIPFITINDTRSFRVKRNLATEQLQQDAQSRWEELIDQEEMPLEKQCIAIQSATTQKRSAIFKIVSTVLSAANLLLRLYPIISAVASLQKPTAPTALPMKKATSMIPYKKKNIQEYPQKDSTFQKKRHYNVIEYLDGLQKHARYIDILFKGHQNVTFALLNEQELKRDFDNVLNYVDKTYEKLIKIIYEDDFKPQNPLDFMTPAQFQDIIHDVKRIYGVNLHNNLKLVKTFITNSKNSYIVTTAIPIEEDGTLTDIFRIHKIPAIDTESRYTPKTSIDYMAVLHQSQHYIPLDSIEATSCAKEGICSALNPTFALDMATCEIANFFDDAKAECEYQISNNTNPIFYILQNRTYYSTGKPINIKLQCTNKLYHIPGSDKTQQISGIGYFELPDTCVAQYKSLTLRPATRTLERMQEKIRPIIKLKAEPFSELTKFIQNIRTNFKPPHIPSKVWKTYVLPLIITIVTVVIGVLIFLIIFCLCLKHSCGRQCCLATCTKYRNYEIAAIERLHNETRFMTELDNLKNNEPKWPERIDTANFTHCASIEPPSSCVTPPPFPETNVTIISAETAALPSAPPPEPTPQTILTSEKSSCSLAS